MANETKNTSSVPVEAVPHLYNAQMLAWQRTLYEALKAIHEEIVKLRQEVKNNGIS